MSFRKIIFSVFMTMAIMLSASFACFADIALEVTESCVKINLDFGEQIAGKKVAVEVFNPSKDFSSITTSSSENLMDVFAFVKQLNADSEGKAEISYTPKGKSGWYTVKAGYENCESYESERFVYVRQKDIDDLLTAIKNSTDTEIIKNVFAEAGGDELSGYVMLESDKTEAFPVFSEASSAVKESIYKSMLANAKDISDAESFNKFFSQAVFSEKLFSINKTKELKEYIEQYAEKLGLTESDIYNDIYLKNTLCDSNVIKPKVLENIINLDWTDAQKADVVGTCEDIIFLTTVYNTNVYERLGELIKAAEDKLKENGANLDELAEVYSETDVYRYISGTNYEDLEAFIETLNDGIDKYSKDEGSSSGGGSSGGGGGGKKAGASVQIPAAADTITPPEVLRSQFKDLENAQWAVDAIEYLAQRGIVSGKAENIFDPDAQMTREEFAKVLVLTFGLSDSTAKAEFADVAPDAWYYEYVASANKKGIIKGYGDSFGTGDYITRQDLATTVTRALEAVGKKAEAKREYKGFSDDSEIADYAKESVKTLYSAGIINGMDENTFAPNGFATRAQVAKIIYGLFVSQEG